MGNPNEWNNEILERSFKFCFTVLPKPMPGSIIILFPWLATIQNVYVQIVLMTNANVTAPKSADVNLNQEVVVVTTNWLFK